MKKAGNIGGKHSPLFLKSSRLVLSFKNSVVIMIIKLLHIEKVGIKLINFKNYDRIFKDTPKVKVENHINPYINLF